MSPITWRHISVPLLVNGDNDNHTTSPFRARGFLLDFSVQPLLFLWPGQSFLESGTYEYRGVLPGKKSGETNLVFILGDMSTGTFPGKEERSHSDNMLYN